MNEREEKKLRQFSSHLLNDYGFEISQSDPVLPALYLVHRELTDNKIGNEEVAKTLKIVLEKLNPTVYNFNGYGEAWKFKMAESMRWLFAGLSIVLAIFACLIWWRQNNDVSRAREIISASSGVHRLLMMATERNENGFIYIELSKAKGRFVENFTQYHEIKTDTIRIYFGKTN
ncbi:MAG: hypothetical protein JST48_08170 [Bacteroidetes bacterium]|nr:hypothetical protein [Bacteroidota bacterium]